MLYKRLAKNQIKLRKKIVLGADISVLHGTKNSGRKTLPDIGIYSSLSKVTHRRESVFVKCLPNFLALTFLYVCKLRTVSCQCTVMSDSCNISLNVVFCTATVGRS